MMRRSCTAVALASLMLAGPALAQQKAPSAKDQQIASDLVQRAFGKLDAADYTAAIDLFLQAYELVPNPLLLTNVAAAFEKNGSTRDALRYFCMYLSKDPSGTNAGFASEQVRSLHVQLGNDDATEQEACAALKKPRKAKPRETARGESVRTEPTEQPTPETRAKPTRTAAQPPGETEIVLGTTEVRKTEDRPSAMTPLSYAGITAGALGVVSLSLGGYYSWKAASISNEVSEGDASPARQREGQRAENLQILTLATGAGLITAGLIMYFVGRPSPASSTVTVAPTHNGLAVFGSF